MSGGVGRRKCRQNLRIGSLLTVFAWQVWTVLFRVWGKCLTDQVWACYINKNHILSNSSLVDDSDTKYDRTTNTNIKEGDDDGNGQVAEPDVKTVDLPVDDAPQGFLT